MKSILPVLALVFSSYVYAENDMPTIFGVTLGDKYIPGSPKYASDRSNDKIDKTNVKYILPDKRSKLFTEYKIVLDKDNNIIAINAEARGYPTGTYISVSENCTKEAHAFVTLLDKTFNENIYNKTHSTSFRGANLVKFKSKSSSINVHYYFLCGRGRVRLYVNMHSK